MSVTSDDYWSSWNDLGSGATVSITDGVLRVIDPSGTTNGNKYVTFYAKGGDKIKFDVMALTNSGTGTQWINLETIGAVKINSTIESTVGYEFKSLEYVIPDTYSIVSVFVGIGVITAQIGDIQAYAPNIYLNGKLFTNYTPETVSVNSSSPALTITQTGSGDALVVEDSANPDSSPFIIGATGNVYQGLTQSYEVASVNARKFQQFSNSVNPSAGASFVRGTDDTSGAVVALGKSRSAVAGSYSIVASGDSLGAIRWGGDDGINLQSYGAEIQAAVDGTPGASDMPGRLVFSTTKDGASSVTEAMRIDNQQRVGLGSVDSKAMFNIGSHTGTATGNAYQRIGGTIPSSATAYLVGYWNETTTPSGAVTYAELAGFKHQPATTGANSTITSMYGFQALLPALGTSATITNGYGFYSNIASNTGRYNFYAAGSADNYLAGKLLIGGLTPVSGAVTYVVDSGLGRDSAYESNTANTLGFRQTFYKSRGSTSAKTIVSSGDEIGLINFYGYDGSAYVQAAAIRAYVDTTPGASDMPGRLSFFTTLDGTTTLSERLRIDNAGNTLNISSGGLGYGTGSGGAVTQTVSRTSGVTLNKTNGAITLVSAAGSASYQSFTVTNSTVAATDTIIINQKSGTDIYEVFITAVAAGSFRVTFATTGGTTTEQPVFNYAVIKAVTA